MSIKNERFNCSSKYEWNVGSKEDGLKQPFVVVAAEQRTAEEFIREACQTLKVSLKMILYRSDLWVVGLWSGRFTAQVGSIND